MNASSQQQQQQQQQQQVLADLQVDPAVYGRAVSAAEITYGVTLSTNPTVRQQAEAEIMQLRDQPFAARLGVALLRLNSNSTTHLQHLGLHLVEAVITRPNRAPYEAAATAKELQPILIAEIGRLLHGGGGDLSSRTSNAPVSRVVADKAARVIAQLAMRSWPDSWPEFDYSMQQLFIARDPAGQLMSLMVFRELASVFDDSCTDPIVLSKRQTLQTALTSVILSEQDLIREYPDQSSNLAPLDSDDLLDDIVSNSSSAKRGVIRGQPGNVGWLARWAYALREAYSAIITFHTNKQQQQQQHVSSTMFAQASDILRTGMEVVRSYMTWIPIRVATANDGLVSFLLAFLATTSNPSAAQSAGPIEDGEVPSIGVAEMASLECLLTLVSRSITNPDQVMKLIEVLVDYEMPMAVLTDSYNYHSQLAIAQDNQDGISHLSNFLSTQATTPNSNEYDGDDGDDEGDLNEHWMACRQIIDIITTLITNLICDASNIHILPKRFDILLGWLFERSRDNCDHHMSMAIANAWYSILSHKLVAKVGSTSQLWEQSDQVLAVVESYFALCTRAMLSIRSASSSSGLSIGTMSLKVQLSTIAQKIIVQVVKETEGREFVSRRALEWLAQTHMSALNHLASELNLFNSNNQQQQQQQQQSSVSGKLSANFSHTCVAEQIIYSIMASVATAYTSTNKSSHINTAGDNGDSVWANSLWEFVHSIVTAPDLPLMLPPTQKVTATLDQKTAWSSLVSTRLNTLAAVCPLITARQPPLLVSVLQRLLEMMGSLASHQLATTGGSSNGMGVDNVPHAIATALSSIATSTPQAASVLAADFGPLLNAVLPLIYTFDTQPGQSKSGLLPAGVSTSLLRFLVQIVTHGEVPNENIRMQMLVQLITPPLQVVASRLQMAGLITSLAPPPPSTVLQWVVQTVHGNEAKGQGPDNQFSAALGMLCTCLPHVERSYDLLATAATATTTATATSSTAAASTTDTSSAVHRLAGAWSSAIATAASTNDMTRPIHRLLPALLTVLDVCQALLTTTFTPLAGQQPVTSAVLSDFVVYTAWQSQVRFSFSGKSKSDSKNKLDKTQASNIGTNASSAASSASKEAVVVTLDTLSMSQNIYSALNQLRTFCHLLCRSVSCMLLVDTTSIHDTVSQSSLESILNGSSMTALSLGVFGSTLVTPNQHSSGTANTTTTTTERFGDVMREMFMPMCRMIVPSLAIAELNAHKQATATATATSGQSHIPSAAVPAGAFDKYVHRHIELLALSWIGASIPTSVFRTASTATASDKVDWQQAVRERIAQDMSNAWLDTMRTTLDNSDAYLAHLANQQNPTLLRLILSSLAIVIQGRDIKCSSGAAKLIPRTILRYIISHQPSHVQNVILAPLSIPSLAFIFPASGNNSVANVATLRYEEVPLMAVAARCYYDSFFNNAWTIYFQLMTSIMAVTLGAEITRQVSNGTFTRAVYPTFFAVLGKGTKTEESLHQMQYNLAQKVREQGKDILPKIATAAGKKASTTTGGGGGGGSEAAFGNVLMSLASGKYFKQIVTNQLLPGRTRQLNQLYTPGSIVIKL
ncbi:hypothetical protein GQ42DRAFT_57566 [Ramicandelaber brevisporus]|nr:hypothetical protein GQ42DRAFT_57566 [Ramicandelaber brevisporus]